MIYIIGGMPGAGKTTYSSELAKKVGGVVFSTDVWMTDLYWMDQAPGEDPAWAFERVKRVENRIRKTAKELHMVGTSAILDLGFVNLEWRKKSYDFLEKNNLAFEVHFLDVDKETRWDRVQKRNQEKGDTFSFEVNREMFDFMEQHFDPIEQSEMSGKLVVID